MPACKMPLCTCSAFVGNRPALDPEIDEADWSATLTLRELVFHPAHLFLYGYL